jgi:hypothetical protein
MDSVALPFHLLVITWTCVGVFVATAVGVLLDLFKVIKLPGDIRKTLYNVVLVEIAVVAVAAFSGVLNYRQLVKQAETAGDTSKDYERVLDFLSELKVENRKLMEELSRVRNPPEPRSPSARPKPAPEPSRSKVDIASPHPHQSGILGLGSESGHRSNHASV